MTPEAQTLEVISPNTQHAAHLAKSAACCTFAQSPDFDHAGAAEHLNRLYTDAQSGLRRVVALGMFCYEMKEVHLKHGYFGRWLEEHCPQISWRSVNAYMDLTKNVMEVCGCQIRSTLRICRGGQILLADEQDLDAESREIRSKIFAVIDGKTQRQLMLGFKYGPEEKPPHVAGGSRKLTVEKQREQAKKAVEQLACHLRCMIAEKAHLEIALISDLNKLEEARVELGHVIKDVIARRTKNLPR